MSENKKFSFRTINKDGNWTVEIVRRAGARKNIISKKQDGFSSEEEANSWGEKELDLFLTHLKSKNKTRNDKHRANN